MQRLFIVRNVSGDLTAFVSRYACTVVVDSFGVNLTLSLLRLWHPQVLRPLLYQLDMVLLEVLVDKLYVQPPEEVIEDTVAFIKDIAEATQQVSVEQ